MKEQIHTTDTAGIWFIVFIVITLAAIFLFLYLKKWKK